MIPVGHKFAMIALCGTRVERPENEPRRVADDVALLFGPATVFDDTWTEWLGTIASDEIKKAQLCVLATRRSEALGILDGENEALLRRAEEALRGFFIAAPPYCKNIRAFTGANEGRGPDIRQVSRMDLPLPSDGVRQDVLKVDQAVDAAELGLDFHEAIFDTPQFDRIKRGFKALYRGLCDADADFKHHQYVRCIEAFLNPKAGKTKKQFVDRCLTFTRDDEAHRLALGEIYDMRCKLEHLHGLLSALGQYPDDERVPVANRRLRQSAWLAHTLYERLARIPHLQRHFKSDAAIDAFWALPDGDRENLWPHSARVDLSSIK